MKTTPDSYVRAACQRSPNLLVPHFLIHSWLYYKADKPIVSDATYDWLAKSLDEKWDDVEHIHKSFIDRSGLAAGTGYYLTYPSRVEHSAKALARAFEPDPVPTDAKAVLADIFS